MSPLRFTKPPGQWGHPGVSVSRRWSRGPPRLEVRKGWIRGFLIESALRGIGSRCI